MMDYEQGEVLDAPGGVDPNAGLNGALRARPLTAGGLAEYAGQFASGGRAQALAIAGGAPSATWFLTAAGLDEWAAARAADANPANCYMPLGLFKPSAMGLPKKLSKDDMSGSRLGWVDIDPESGAFGRDGAMALVKRIKQVVSGSLDTPINWAVYSGRGLWVGVKFDEWQPVDVVEGVNLFLRFTVAAMGLGVVSDACHNIDRIARLPGTVNSKTGEVAKGLEFLGVPLLTAPAAVAMAREGHRLYAAWEAQKRPGSTRNGKKATQGQKEANGASQATDGGNEGKVVKWTRRWAVALETMEHPSSGNGSAWSGDRSRSSLLHRAVLWAAGRGYGEVDILVAVRKTRLGQELAGEQDLARAVGRSFAKAAQGGSAAGGVDGEFGTVAGYHQRLEMELVVESFGERLLARASGKSQVELLVRDDFGLWHVVGERAKDRGRGVLTGLMRAARLGSDRAEVQMLPESDRHFTSVINLMLKGAAMMPIERPGDFGLRWRREAVLPIWVDASSPDGGGWLVNERRRMSAEELSSHRIEAGWGIMGAPDFGVLEDPAMAWIGESVRHFVPWLDRLAWTMLRLEKSVDLVKLATINRGKSALVSALSRAFSEFGFAYMPSHGAPLPIGDGFTGLWAGLGTAMYMVVDEADKIPPAGMAAVDRLLAQMVFIHFKFEELRLVHRTAGVSMLGNDWPKFLWADPGMVGEDGNRGRVDACPLLLDAAGDAPRMSREIGYRFYNEPEPARWLLAWIVQRAQVYSALGDDAEFEDHCLPETLEALTAGRKEIADLAKRAAEESAKQESASSEDVQRVMDQLEYTNDWDDWVVKQDLKKALGRGHKSPGDLLGAMRKAAGGRHQDGREDTAVDREGNQGKFTVIYGWRWKATGDDTAVDAAEEQPVGGFDDDDECDDAAAV